MTYVITEPQIMAAVASDVEGIGSAISAAHAAAAGPTASLLAPAADEVSTAITKFFGAYSQDYQAVVKHAAAFHNEFTQALAAAGHAYANAEGASAATLAAPQFTPINADLTLFLGPTGNPTPTNTYVTNANNLYVRSTNALQALFTPEELYPLTGVKSMTLNSSVAEGLNILNTAITQQLPQGSTKHTHHLRLLAKRHHRLAGNAEARGHGSAGSERGPTSLRLGGQRDEPQRRHARTLPGAEHFEPRPDVLRRHAGRHDLPNRHLHAGIRRLRRLPPVSAQRLIRPQRRHGDPHRAHDVRRPVLGSSRRHTDPSGQRYSIDDVSRLLHQRRRHALLHDSHRESAAVGPGAGHTGHRQPDRRPAPARLESFGEFGLRQPRLRLVDRIREHHHPVRFGPARRRERRPRRSGHRNPAGSPGLQSRPDDHPRHADHAAEARSGIRERLLGTDVTSHRSRRLRSTSPTRSRRSSRPTTASCSQRRTPCFPS